jgi:hypothetical protein
VSRFVEAPVAPSAIDTVPLEIDWLAEVELVNVANVPNPAIAAATPRIANEAKAFIRVLFMLGRFLPSEGTNSLSARHVGTPFAARMRPV